MRRKNRRRISMKVRRILAMTVVCTLLSVLFVQPMVGMESVQAASYVAAGEYDGIGADTIANCVAFARYKVPSLPGGLYTLQDKQNIINSHTPMAGAIAITSGNSSYGHVAYVESVSGANVVTLNGGFSGSGLTGHIVRITGTESEQGILGYWYPAGLSAGNNPSASASYSNIAVEFVDNWNAGLYGRIENPGRSVVSGVGVHIWDSAGNLVVDYTEGCGLQTSYVEQRLNIVAEALPGGLRSGETYTFEMFAGINGTTVMSPMGSFTCTDLEMPVMTDTKVYNVGQDGYMVSCKATDNFKIDRVQFPTWTLAGGQDDLPDDWPTNPLFQGTQDGDTYTFYVKCSEHNNEHGTYQTHIYAWDKAGNCASVAVDDVIIEDMDVEDTPQPSTPTPKPNDFVPEQSSKPSSATNTPKPSSQGAVSKSTPTPTISPVVENNPPAITVPKVQGLSVKNQKGRKVKCSWKGISGTIYYSVQFASNRSFTKGNKGLKVSGTKHTRYSLKKNKTYYVRVRAWRYVTGSGYVAGEWSAVKKVKVKK